MTGVNGIGQPSNTGYPTGRGHGDAQVIERGATTQDRVAAGLVGGGHRPVAIDEQVDNIVLRHPPPGLAVVN
jgi:hypothetical protein